MTDIALVTIRPAIADDAEALAWLHVEAWEDAYVGLMPATVFEDRRHTLSARTERWRQMLEAARSCTTVGEASSGLVGFIHVGKPRDEDVIADAEIRALYTRARWWGKGLGHALMAATVGDHQTAYLWVLDGNVRAIAFYRKHGFVVDGVTRTDECGTELRMAR